MGKNKKNLKQDSKKAAAAQDHSPVQSGMKVHAPLTAEEKKRKRIAQTALGVTVLLFVLIWIEPPMHDFQDPWYTAIRLVDSSRKVQDPTLKEKLLEEGGSMLKSLSAKHPYHARVHYFLGVYYSMKQDWDNAIAEHTKAVEIGSGGLVNNVEFDAQRDLIGALFSKANSLLDKKLIDSSIKYYNSALDQSKKLRMTKKLADLMPHLINNLSVAYMQKGNELNRNGNLDSALACYEQSVSVNPRRADALNNIGTIYSKKGNRQKALEYFNKALQVEPENQSARNNLNALRKSQGTSENQSNN